MADVEIEDILRKPEQYVTDAAHNHLVVNAWLDMTKTSTKSEDSEKEADKEAETEEQVAGDYLQMAADVVAAVTAMDNSLSVDDLETISTNDVTDYLEESDDAEENLNAEQVEEEVDNLIQDSSDAGSNKSKRSYYYGIESEESLLDQEVATLRVMEDEEEEDVTVSDADMKNAHYMKTNTAEGVVERKHDVDLTSENSARAEGMKRAESAMESLEKETKDAEQKIAQKESKVSLKGFPNFSGDGAKATKDEASKEGHSEPRKTEFVSATIEKLCFELEDGVVWRKTHTKKRIRKKIFGSGGLSDEDEAMYA